MGTKKVLCEICDTFEARTRDYREIDGCTSKMMACGWCANLNNVAVYQIMNEKVDPLSFYDNIDYELLSASELEELKDIKYEIVLDQLEEFDVLDELLEIERELTRKEEENAKVS